MNEVAVANLMPQTQEAKYQMAGVLAKSGLIPSGLNTAEKVFVALQWGHELGLTPMVAVNNIAVINGKPTLSADIMCAIVKRSPEYGGIEWIEMSNKKAECKISRILPNGDKETQTCSFTLEDAERAGLLGKDVWKKYTKRMLKHRCLSSGLKDMFPDLLAGLYDPEEMESVQSETTTERNVTPVEEPAEKNITPEPNPQFEEHQKLKTIIEKYKADLDVENQNGNPFNLACEALAENDPEKISKMLVRVTKYLGAKGKQVA